MAADIRTLATLRLRPVAIGVTLLVVLGILFSASESSRDAVWTRMRWRYENDSPDRPKMTTEELRQLVGDEPSFLVRDSHAEYGNNNKRYVFEITLLLARLMNRIPVLPDSVWARSCVAEDIEQCNQHSLAHSEHRNDHFKDVGIKWNQDGGVWKLPIEEFVDIEHLRLTYGPALTAREFYDMYDMPDADLTIAGHFDPHLVPPSLTLETMTSEELEARPKIRVDAIERQIMGDPKQTLFNETFVRQAIGDRLIWTLDEAREALRQAGLERQHLSDAEIDRALVRAEVTRLYTFDNANIMNKAVTALATEYTYTSNVVPLVTDRRAKSPNTILYIPGEVHDQRKPGVVRFTSARERQDFIDFVVNSIQPPRPISVVAESIAGRMSGLSQGRGWIGVHLRRGDFVQINWTPVQDVEAHLNRTLAAIARANELLQTHQVKALPESSDPWYLATDETDPDALELFRKAGALTLHDLMNDDDREYLGWQANFGDILALVDQQVLARSSFFVGSSMSSTTGGVLNQRQHLDKPAWSSTFVQ